MILLQVLSHIALTYFTAYCLKDSSKNRKYWGYPLLIILGIMNTLIFIILELKTTKVTGCMTYIIGFVPIGAFCLILSLTIYYALTIKNPSKHKSASRDF